MKEKSFEITLILIALAILFDLLSGGINYYYTNDLMSILVEEGSGLKYQFLVILQTTLSYMDVAVNIVIAIFLYSLSVNNRVMWSNVGLVFGALGMILFFTNHLHNNHYQNKPDNKFTIFSFLLWPIVLGSLSFYLYQIYFYFQLPNIVGGFGETIAKLKLLSLYTKFFNYTILITLNVMACIWVLTVSKRIEHSKWFTCVVTLFLGLLGPIIFLIYSVIIDVNNHNISANQSPTRTR